MYAQSLRLHVRSFTVARTPFRTAPKRNVSTFSPNASVPASLTSELVEQRLCDILERVRRSRKSCLRVGSPAEFIIKTVPSQLVLRHSGANVEVPRNSGQSSLSLEQERYPRPIFGLPVRWALNTSHL
jgi:Lon protease-like protein